MQVNLPEDTVERCKRCMNKRETWGAFIERILDESPRYGSPLVPKGESENG
jgi:hypothetical protein